LQTDVRDVYPEDKLEEDEKLPMPKKQKIDMKNKDIESRGSVNVLK